MKQRSWNFLCCLLFLLTQKCLYWKMYKNAHRIFLHWHGEFDSQLDPNPLHNHKALSYESRISLRMRNEWHFLTSVHIRFMPFWSFEGTLIIRQCALFVRVCALFVRHRRPEGQPLKKHLQQWHRRKVNLWKITATATSPKSIPLKKLLQQRQRRKVNLWKITCNNDIAEGEPLKKLLQQRQRRR